MRVVGGVGEGGWVGEDLVRVMKYFGEGGGEFGDGGELMRVVRVVEIHQGL